MSINIDKDDFQIFCNTPDTVGESPIWNKHLNCFHWVDIVGKTIRKQGLSDTQSHSCDVNDFPVGIALRQNHDNAVAVFASGVAEFDFINGTKGEHTTVVDNTQGNRLNEAKCDPMGRLWIGSMQNNLNPDGSAKDMNKNSGALFRLDGDKSISRHTDFEYGISNTMAWSPDLKTFYFGDSIRNVIFAFDYDNDDGVLSNQRVLVENYPYGVPDGSTIDQDGCIWNTRFAGSRIIRITPDGKIDAEIDVPVTNPTSCTFGGKDKNMLLITSAQFTLTEQQLKDNPDEGKAIIIELSQKGLKDYKFNG